MAKTFIFHGFGGSWYPTNHGIDGASREFPLAGRGSVHEIATAGGWNPTTPNWSQRFRFTLLETNIFAPENGWLED